jgi:acyl-CoA synthetase (AMP-forming)/AMP-acid ligase II
VSPGLYAPDLLGVGLGRYPKRACVTLEDRSLTFQEVDERARRLMDVMTRRGMRCGDRVAVLALNDLEWTEIRVATQRLGIAAVPLNYRLSNEELRGILEDCAPSLLIAGHDLAEVAAEICDRDTLVLGAEPPISGGQAAYEEELARAHAHVGTASVDATQVGVISYTSGTTGTPKGVMVCNGALYAMMVSLGQEIGARPGKAFLTVNPMFHLGVQVAFSFTYVGATCHQLRRFDPGELLALTERRPVTHAQLLPTMIRALDSAGGAQVPGFERVLYGGSPMTPELTATVMERWRCELVNAYGCTEAMAVSALPPHDHDPARPDLLRSVGRCGIGMSVKIVDDEGVEMGPGDVGEVVARGPHVMSGYWQRAGATAEALRDGWLYTGDLAFRDPDGYLYLVDRRNDKIVTGGENVFPSEVERVLRQHPKVDDVAVIGIPDNYWGEAVCAVIVPASDATWCMEEELARFVRQRVASYKAPKQWRFSSELPRNATGKVLRRVLRDEWSSLAS